MKISLACLFVALCWNIAATQQLSIYSEHTQTDRLSDIYLANGAYGHWASIIRFNRLNPQIHGYDPTHTVVMTSWRPVVREISKNRWQVSFELP